MPPKPLNLRTLVNVAEKTVPLEGTGAITARLRRRRGDPQPDITIRAGDLDPSAPDNQRFAALDLDDDGEDFFDRFLGSPASPEDSSTADDAEYDFSERFASLDLD
jgi:hypothetical protein